jgi:hypothetical protein
MLTISGHTLKLELLPVAWCTSGDYTHRSGAA